MSAQLWSSEQYDDEAQARYESGDYDGALELLEEGMRLYPASAELRVSAGYAQLAREEFLWARRAFEEALVLDPEHEEALIGLGEALLWFGERTRALRAFDRVLELGYRDDLPLMLAVGRALYRHRLYDKAERYFRLAVAAEPASGEAAAELGYALHLLDRSGEAVEWLERALELEPELYEARAFYANQLYEAARPGRALEEFRRIPVGEMWDPLAVWRTIELLRGYEGLPPEAEELEPYLARMEELNPEVGPEERLLAEVEAAAEDGELDFTDENQLELFRGEEGEADGGWSGGDRPAHPASGPDAHGPGDRGGRHTVRALDGHVYTGSWLGIVRAMRDASPDPSVSLRGFMRRYARRVEKVTGVPVPTDSPESFVRGAARAGMLQIER